MKYIQKHGGPAFPCAAEWGVGEAPFVQEGMSLRDYFASTMDRDEYGEIAFKNLSVEAKEIITGESKPPSPNEGKTREERVNLQVANAKWELKVRASIRFMWADAMLSARKEQTETKA